MQKALISFVLTFLVCFAMSSQNRIEIGKKNENLLDKSVKAYTKRNFDKALKYIKSAMRSEEVNKIASVSLLEGNIHFALKDFEEAKNAYLKSIEVSKIQRANSRTAQIGLARSIIKLEKLEKKETKNVGSDKGSLDKDNTSSVTDTKINTKDTEEENTAFTIIEQVPIYPGCDSGTTNAALKKCMQQGITDHVSKNFNIDVAGITGLNGKIIINCQFTINKKGDVTNIYATALHPIFEEEAIRVIDRLPKMKPGEQKGKPVGVIYGLPIIFNVK